MDNPIITNNGGWLFDIYHLKDKIVLWIKEKDGNGNIKRLEYPWSPSIYVASDTKTELTSLTTNSQISHFIKEFEFEYKFEYPSPNQIKQEVLRLTVKDSSQIINLAKSIEKLCKRFGQYRLYNVDVTPEQIFCMKRTSIRLDYIIL